MKFRKGIIEITTAITIITFLGTGLYKMYKMHKEVTPLQSQEQNLKELQNKYCNVDNPTPEQQKICIELLKVRVKENGK